MNWKNRKNQKNQMNPTKEEGNGREKNIIGLV
jgi:hypothetical protein